MDEEANVKKEQRFYSYIMNPQGQYYTMATYCGLNINYFHQQSLLLYLCVTPAEAVKSMNHFYETTEFTTL